MVKKENVKFLLLLQIILAVYSTSGVLMKTAALQSSANMKLCLCYGAAILLLGLYAVVWQQIIKRIPLTVAFASKAITVVWGIIWGAVFFHEAITAGKVIGAILIIAGIVIFSTVGGAIRDE